VTRYNNTQNAIRISDFRSNDRIQIDLAKRFDALPARGGRKFVYNNKRSGEREANKIAITMEEFTKTIHAFLLGPDDVFGGAQYLFDTSKDGGYLKLFGDGGDLLPVLSDAQFKRYAGIWFLCEFARDVWRKETDSNSSEALERRWMVFYALGESIRLAYAKTGNDVQEALERLSDPNWYPSGSPERIKDVASR
jgi:AIPR protein